MTTPPPASGPAPRNLLDDAVWAAPIVVLGVALGAFVALEPEWGANAAGALGVPLAVIAIVVSVLVDRGAFRVTRRRSGGPRRWQKKLGVYATVTLTVLGLAWWTIRREGDPFDYLTGEIRIGYTDGNYPGWHTRPNGITGDYGFDVALVNALKKTFYKADFTWVKLSSPADREPALQGKPWRPALGGDELPPVQLVVSNYSITPKRQLVIDFAGPYFTDVQGIISRSGKTIPTATDNLLCALAGTTGRDSLGGIGWRLDERPTLDLCYAAYRNKEVAGMTTDLAILKPYAEKYKIEPAPMDLGSAGDEQYGIGIPNNRPRLCAALNEALDEFMQRAWDSSFTTYLASSGVQRASNPKKTAPCERAGPESVK